MRRLFQLAQLFPAAAIIATVIAASAATVPAVAQSIGYVNGQVYTGDGWASAIAIGGDKIVAVGDDAAIKRSLPPRSPVVDLEGRTVFPGLYDLHVHSLTGGRSLKTCKFGRDAGIDAIVATVAKCVKTAEPGAWVFGGEWSIDAPHVAKFDKLLLDNVASNNPVVLADSTGHNVWANSKALLAGGFTRDVQDPADGKIERDANGEPTGLLREGPANKLRYLMPAANPAEATALVGAALEALASYGITSIEDAAVKMDEANGYSALADAGRLKQHVRGCILWNKESAAFDHILSNRAKYERPNFRLDCVKVFMDYAPNESHTAAMFDPYTVKAAEEKPTRGDLVVDPEILAANLIKWDKAGIVVKIHAGGDLAVHQAMDAIARARAANGPAGPQHQVVHNSFAAAQDLARAQPLNIALEFSPVFWYPSPLAENIAEAVGPKRAARAWPAKEAIESGALIFGASDWPAVESPSPWVAIETLVTRQAPGGKGEPYGSAEAVTLEQAIKMYTQWPAAAFGRPGDTGTIHVGGAADLVILDRNPFKAPITEVHATKTLRTIADGEVIYDSGELGM